MTMLFNIEGGLHMDSKALLDNDYILTVILGYSSLVLTQLSITQVLELK